MVDLPRDRTVSVPGRKSWDAFVEELMQDPETRAAFEAAQARQAREVEGVCENGRCVEFRDPDTNEVTGGWGPVGCGCKGSL